MTGKQITLPMSAGVDEYEYSSSEKKKYTLQSLIRPYELTCEYMRADYQPFLPITAWRKIQACF